MYTVQFLARKLLAMLHISPSEDIRYYLNSVLLEVVVNNNHEPQAFLVATDGESLVAQYATSGSKDSITGVNANADEFKLILPRSILEKVKAGKNDVVKITAKPTAVNSVFEFMLDILSPDGEAKQSLRGKSVDGVYPDWRRAIPADYSMAAARINPKLISVLVDCYTAYAGLKKDAYIVPSIYTNKDDAAWVSFDDQNFVALVMPMRKAQGGQVVIPEWIEARRPKSERIITFANNRAYKVGFDGKTVQAYLKLRLDDIAGMNKTALSSYCKELAVGQDARVSNEEIVVEADGFDTDRIVLSVKMQLVTPKFNWG